MLLGFNNIRNAFPERCSRVNAKEKVNVVRTKCAFVETKSDNGKKCFPSPKPEVRDVKEEAHCVEWFEQRFIELSQIEFKLLLKCKQVRVILEKIFLIINLFNFAK